MADLFEKTTINGMELPNRFIRSATWTGMAEDDGRCTEKLTDYMLDLVHGGVGLLITGHTYVSPDGQAGLKQLGIYSDGMLQGLSDMTARIHEAGGKVVTQLTHAGVFADTKLTGQPALTFSKTDAVSEINCREVSGHDIKELVSNFGQAAARAKKAGFDGVQIHCAHGYLLSQSLSPIFNQRGDEYGGGIEDRARTLIMVFDEIRNRVGSDYPVMIKMNVQDYKEDGLTVEEAVKVAIILEVKEIDAIELSGGVLTARKLGPTRTGIKTEEKEAYFLNDAKEFRKNVNIPLMLVGGIRSFNVAEKLIRDGHVDYISMCRPLISEPDLIKKWKSGNRERAFCRSDNLCFVTARDGLGISCLTKTKIAGNK